MESKLEILVKESVTIAKVKFSDCDNVKMYEEGIRKFDELLEKGILRERGNNLRSISDNVEKCTIQFNTK
jgi:hypothetical protein